MEDCLDCQGSRHPVAFNTFPREKTPSISSLSGACMAGENYNRSLSLEKNSRRNTYNCKAHCLLSFAIVVCAKGRSGTIRTKTRPPPAKSTHTRLYGNCKKAATRAVLEVRELHHFPAAAAAINGSNGGGGGGVSS